MNSRKFDITEAFIQALQEQQLKELVDKRQEARSHKEDNEKAAPRTTIRNGKEVPTRDTQKNLDNTFVGKKYVKGAVANNPYYGGQYYGTTDAECKSKRNKTGQKRTSTTDMSKKYDVYKADTFETPVTDYQVAMGRYKDYEKTGNEDMPIAQLYKKSAQDIVNKERERIANKSNESKRQEARSHKEDNKKVKDYIKEEITPDIDDGSTVSLLGVAYRDIPKVGVESWGKDNELYFYLDTKELLSYLEDYEVEIPKYLVDNEDEPVEAYLLEYLGINPNDGEFDNSYNWGSRLTHDLEIATYTSKEDDNFYVKISVHREGDVRGNYTTDFLLRFDDKDTFYVVMLDAQLSCANTFEFEGKRYWVEPHIFDEHVDISVEGGEEDWSDIYCEDLDQLKEIISENSEE